MTELHNPGTETAARPTLSVEQLAGTDLVVGILAELSPELFAQLCADLRGIPGAPRIAVLQSHAAGGSEGISESSAQDSSVLLVPWALQEQNLTVAPVETFASAYTSLFALASRVGARGLCVVTSNLEHAPARWICRLTQPLLDRNCDFVAPRYALHKFEGLLNSAIISPLMRALYGKRIQNPLGPDFGLSRQLVQALAAGATQNGSRGGSGVDLLASIVPRAACENLPIGQAYIGARAYPPIDWTGVSSLLSQIVGPVLSGMERNAACWQKTRASASVNTLSEPLSIPQTTSEVEIARLVNSFQLGVRDLQEIWGLVLPPATLLELRKLSRLSTEQHRLPDELWARIVYDFALAHRLRIMNRDHLLRSMTPLYLGWVASYAHELETAESVAVELRLEKLALAYESQKPYLVSRWRWPDRFNP